MEHFINKTASNVLVLVTRQMSQASRLTVKSKVFVVEPLNIPYTVAVGTIEKCPPAVVVNNMAVV